VCRPGKFDPAQTKTDLARFLPRDAARGARWPDQSEALNAIEQSGAFCGGTKTVPHWPPNPDPHFILSFGKKRERVEHTCESDSERWHRASECTVQEDASEWWVSDTSVISLGPACGGAAHESVEGTDRGAFNIPGGGEVLVVTMSYRKHEVTQRWRMTHRFLRVLARSQSEETRSLGTTHTQLDLAAGPRSAARSTSSVHW
jgi:hypothetical protein